MTNKLTHLTLDSVKTVDKPWGYEKWIQQGQDDHTYVLKEIFLKKGYRTSLQVHKYKSETNYILEGSGEIWFSKEPIDCDKYVNGGYSTEDINRILDRLERVTYTPGSVMQIDPGIIHRMVASTDLRFVEASTCHLDDVIRLQDDVQRGHGRIDSEHK